MRGGFSPSLYEAAVLDAQEEGDELALGVVDDIAWLEDNPTNAPQPVPLEDRTKNPLRPTRFAGIIGQERTKAMMARVVATARRRREPLDHVLLTAASGLGKTTFATVIGAELGSRVFQVEAPVSHETLLSLREAMHDRDVLFIDEIHQQAVMERRGRTTSAQPEVLFSVMEDRTIVSGTGVLPFPAITIIGATTDEGMLPDPFIFRFPLRPHLEPYTVEELANLAGFNATALKRQITVGACERFAQASRGVPRQINNYVRNAVMLNPDATVVTEEAAQEVVNELNQTTDDGLTLDQQKVLRFLLDKGRHVRVDGTVVYSASVSTLATAIGKSRDSKAIVLRVEPHLIERGFLQVGHGIGRRLTDTGIKRAEELA